MISAASVKQICVFVYGDVAVTLRVMQTYAEVLRVFPGYWDCHKWLKENGAQLMRRMTG